uniref:CRAL-TRIO domain-containing protein n=1 Tax=Heterorhabditis bacteriophora TaxID=37862 RepID=A0A1I7XE58_HETBA
MVLTDEARAAIDRVRRAAGGEHHPYCAHDFNVHRWIVAYEGDENQAARVGQNIMSYPIFHASNRVLKNDDIDEETEKYTPLTILGRNRLDDNKIILFEQSGRIDINGVVDNVRVTRFLRMKFRTMERLQQRVQIEEERTKRQSGGVLIMDLEGLSFSTRLLSVLAGPYRIIWGTLFEQYPQLIQQIIVINAPKYINLLYQTCIPFVPRDYKDKIIISSGNPKETMLKYIDEEYLPVELGGQCDMNCSGDYEIYTPIQSDRTAWQEIYAGCERPALPQVDTWKWTVPYNGCISDFRKRCLEHTNYIFGILDFTIFAMEMKRPGYSPWKYTTVYRR